MACNEMATMLQVIPKHWSKVTKGLKPQTTFSTSLISPYENTWVVMLLLPICQGGRCFVLQAKKVELEYSMQDNVMLLWCHYKGTFSLSLCYIVLWSTHLSFFKLITCQLVAVSDPVVIVHMSCGIPVSRFAYHVLPTKGREKTFTTAQLPLSFFFPL